jgi:hypothetical protein
MLASVEYMLCGLPQVSTPCRGGREPFFDERFVQWLTHGGAVAAESRNDLKDVTRTCTAGYPASSRAPARSAPTCSKPSVGRVTCRAPRPP